MTRLLWIPALLLLAGCNTTQHYNWGSYDRQLYQYYKQPETQEQFRRDLQALLERQERLGKLPPPGLFAELGTLCLVEGDLDCAVASYQREHDLWPESRILMSSLIRTLNPDTTDTTEGESQP